MDTADITQAAAINAARTSLPKQEKPEKSRKSTAADGTKGAKTLAKSNDKTKRKPGKTDGANLSGTSGKFTSRSGKKAVEATTGKKSTVKSSANKQPGSRTPKGAGAATAEAGTARKGHRIEAAQKARAASRQGHHA